MGRDRVYSQTKLAIRCRRNRANLSAERLAERREKNRVRTALRRAQLSEEQKEKGRLKMQFRRRTRRELVVAANLEHRSNEADDDLIRKIRIRRSVEELARIREQDRLRMRFWRQNQVGRKVEEARLVEKARMKEQRCRKKLNTEEGLLDKVKAWMKTSVRHQKPQDQVILGDYQLKEEREPDDSNVEAKVMKLKPGEGIHAVAILSKQNPPPIKFLMQDYYFTKDLVCELSNRQAIKNRGNPQEHSEDPLVKGFKCPYCSSVFKQSRHILNSHLLGHGYGPRCTSAYSRFSCYCTTAMYKSREEYVHHLRSFHPQEEVQVDDTMFFYECDYPGCFVQFRDKSQFTLHLVTGHGQVFSCEECDRSYSFLANYEHHMTQIHSKNSSSSSMACDCPFCYGIFSLKEFWAHLSLHALTLSNWKEEESLQLLCDLCGEVFPSQPSLDKHRICEHRHMLSKQDLRNTGNSLKECQVCCKKFFRPTADQLGAHYLRYHTYEHGTLCYICNRRFKTLYALNVHLKQHAGTPILTNRHNCFYCTKVFPGYVTRNRHHVLAHPDKLATRRFHCTVCFRTFSTEAELQGHYTQVHAKWKCSICSVQHISQAAFENHLEAHERPGNKIGRQRKARATNQVKMEALLKQVGDPIDPSKFEDTPAETMRRLKLNKDNYFFGVTRRLARVRDGQSISDQLEESLEALESEPMQDQNVLENPILMLEKPVAVAKKSRKPYDDDIAVEIRPLFPFACELCVQQFPTAETTLEHHTAVHQHEQIHQEDLLDHYKNPRFGSTTSKLQSVFKCTLCEHTVDSAPQAVAHRATHGNDPAAAARYTVECDVCHRKFRGNRDLVRHMKICGNALEVRRFQEYIQSRTEPLVQPGVRGGDDSVEKIIVSSRTNNLGIVVDEDEPDAFSPGEFDYDFQPTQEDPLTRTESKCTLDDLLKKTDRDSTEHEVASDSQLQPKLECGSINKFRFNDNGPKIWTKTQQLMKSRVTKSWTRGINNKCKKLLHSIPFAYLVLQKVESSETEGIPASDKTASSASRSKKRSWSTTTGTTKHTKLLKLTPSPKKDPGTARIQRISRSIRRPKFTVETESVDGDSETEPVLEADLDADYDPDDEESYSKSATNNPSKTVDSNSSSPSRSDCESERSQKGRVTKRQPNSPRIRSKHIPSTPGSWPCYRCPAIFDTRSQLSRHRLHAHPTVKHITCEVCRQQFPTRLEMTRHRAADHKGIRCPICDKFFYLEIWMDGHLARKHKGIVKPYKCSVCEYFAREQSGIRLHEEVKHGILHEGRDQRADTGRVGTRNGELWRRSRFPCEFCRMVLPSRTRYHGHVRNHLGTPPAIEAGLTGTDVLTMISCDVDSCTSTFRTRALLLAHFLTHSLNSGPFECSNCDRVFGLESNLTKHLEIRHHDGSGESSKQNVFDCLFCMKRLKTREEVGKHEELHRIDLSKPLEGKQPFCELCNKEFADINRLNLHVRTKHFEMNVNVKVDWSRPQQKRKCFPAKKYACPYCPSQLRCLSRFNHQYKKHRSEFERDNRFFCDLCYRPGETAVVVQQHRETHDQLKCSICEKQFLRKEYFETHMRSHQGSKLFQCSQCGKSFSTASILKEHERRHEKQYSVYCPICPDKTVGFFRKCHLDQHLQSYHRDGERTPKRRRGRQPGSRNQTRRNQFDSGDPEVGTIEDSRESSDQESPSVMHVL